MQYAFQKGGIKPAIPRRLDLTFMRVSTQKTDEHAVSSCKFKIAEVFKFMDSFYNHIADMNIAPPHLY